MAESPHRLESWHTCATSFYIHMLKGDRAAVCQDPASLRYIHTLYRNIPLENPGGRSNFAVAITCWIYLVEIVPAADRSRTVTSPLGEGGFGSPPGRSSGILRYACAAVVYSGCYIAHFIAPRALLTGRQDTVPLFQVIIADWSTGPAFFCTKWQQTGVIR